MNKFSKELIESLTEACEHAEGKPGAVRVHVVDRSGAPSPRHPNKSDVVRTLGHQKPNTS